jgi:hypothetical protein
MAGIETGTSSTSFAGARRANAVVFARERLICQARSDLPSTWFLRAHPRSVSPDLASADKHARASLSSTTLRNPVIATSASARIGRAALPVIPASLMGHDATIIATGLGQLLDEGRIDAPAKPFIKVALRRQLHPSVVTSDHRRKILEAALRVVDRA